MSPVDAELIAVDDYKGLAADWCALELTADGSPFTAWQWVSVWLRNLPAQTRPSVFRASDRDGLLALALLVTAPGRKLRNLLGGHSLLLQETGNADIDEVTVEYSGLLVRRGSEVRAYSALFDTLTRIKQWQSLRISASPHARAVTASLPDGLDAFSAHEQPSYLVDLAAVRASGAEYISVLSSSTRYNLRRTRRAYEVHGEVRAEIAATPAQALDWLHELRTLHQRYWLGKGKRGSFGSAFFSAFHEDLVREGTDTGFTHLVRVSAGPLLVGYLYNLHWRNRVYFYNGGLNYGAVERQDRPGYLAHLAAIERYLADGVEIYDFLAGEGDYKRMMGSHLRMLNWMDIKRHGWRLSFEQTLAPLFGRQSTSLPMVDPASSEPVRLEK